MFYKLSQSNGHLLNSIKSQSHYIYYFFIFKNSMKRELKKEELAKLYRQFSRQKYNKYKHQYPRMRESELVSKIIKEWEAMGSEEKEQLYNTYSAEKHISDDKSESSEKKDSPGSSKQKKKKSLSKSVTKGATTRVPVFESSSTPAKKSGVRMFVRSSSSKKQKAQSESSDFARDGVKKDFEVSESDSKELGVKVGGKKKKISKSDARQPRTQYLKFFKFYYEKLTGEHARWSASQISTIIKLLWKKKLSQDKTSTKSSLRPTRERKSISGRLAFRRSFNYNGIQGAERWKQLPVESKKYWRARGFGTKSGERRVITPTVNFKKIGRKSSESSINTQVGKNLSYLKKTIA